MTFVAQHDLNCPANYGGKCNCHQSQIPELITAAGQLQLQINELTQYRNLVFKYIDRMRDPDEVADPLEKIVGEFCDDFKMIQDFERELERSKK